jgi:hypothetical protein
MKLPFVSRLAFDVVVDAIALRSSERSPRECSCRSWKRKKRAT